jgi:hypothetical protein
MSAIVENIFDAITSLAQTTFGVDYVRLRKVREPEENDFRNIQKAFGVRHGQANSTEGVTRVYTMNQRFEVLIVNAAVDRNDDAAVQDVFHVLYNLADEFLKSAFLTKLGLGSTVLLVDLPELSEPTVLANGAAILIVGFNVRYRQAIA